MVVEIGRTSKLGSFEITQLFAFCDCRPGVGAGDGCLVVVATLGLAAQMRGSKLEELAMNDMDMEAVENSRHRYKLACENCGSLTIALPANARPDPQAVLTCGRCGSPRGTLQALRDRSIAPSAGVFE